MAQATLTPKPRTRLLKPLAPAVYLLRNWGKTTPLIGVILLAVMLIGGIVAMMNSIPLSIRTIYGYSQNLLGLSPRGDPELTPKMLARVKAEAPVPIERIITCRVSGTVVRSIVGKWPFVVLGLTPEDTDYYLKRMRVERIEGRLPEPGKPEVLISEPVARNLNKGLGDALLKPDDPEGFSPFEVKIVGIAQTQNWLMVNSIDYQRANHFPNLEHLMVFARTAEEQRTLDRWAEEAFKGERAQVLAYHILEKDTDEMFNILYMVLNVVIGLLVLVITTMMAMLMNIYQSQRLVEFGLLQALGYTRRQLLGRVMRESVSVLVGGWLVGVLAAYGLLSLLKSILFYPNAFSLDPLDPVALLYTVPVPIAILIAATLTVMIRFRKFDPVAVVERRLV